MTYSDPHCSAPDDHPSYHAAVPAEPRSVSGIGSVPSGRKSDQEKAIALIRRARHLLQDDAPAASLQDALDALEGKASQRTQQAMIVQAELRHRFHNIIGVTQSLVRQTLRSGASVDDARERLADRLSAMGAAVDVLLAAEWEPCPLGAALKASLAHHGDQSQRIRTAGPNVMIGSKAVMPLTLALHELETNAIKYGALSVPAGVVDIVWALVGSECQPKLWLQWSEHGGPAVSPPERQGLGTRLVSGAISYCLSADVSLEYKAGGLAWSIIAPLSTLSV